MLAGSGGGEQGRQEEKLQKVPLKQCAVFLGELEGSNQGSDLI